MILPDGRIVVVGGHSSSQAPLRAEYVTLSPTGLTVTQGGDVMVHERGYHTIALLLQDGRILVAGGRPGGPTGSPYFERADYTILSPAYVQGRRPQITFVTNKVLRRTSTPPSETPTSTPVGVVVEAGDVPSEAVLISLGSMTHSFDMNQRSVEVAITDLVPVAFSTTTTTYSMKISAPEYEWAPPGYYMLFILDQDRIPSPAAMIRLE